MSRPGMILRVMREMQSPADALLMAKACGWAFVLPMIKHCVGVNGLATMMRKSPQDRPRDRAREIRIVTFARWSARLARWRSGGNCLERGLIAYRYLCEAGADPMLVVGIGRGERGVVGHAWVLIEGCPVGESSSALGMYTPVFAFASTGQLVAGAAAERAVSMNDASPGSVAAPAGATVAQPMLNEAS